MTERTPRFDMDQDDSRDPGEVVRQYPFAENDEVGELIDTCMKAIFALGTDDNPTLMDNGKGLLVYGVDGTMYAITFERAL